MRKTYLYRASINKQTKANCNKWLNLCRTLYNYALEQRIGAYRQSGKSISAIEQKNQLPEFKENHPEFKTIGSQVLQDVIERLDKSFQGFFRRLKQKNGEPGFPRFKSRNRYDSFTLKQAGWSLEGRYLYIKNVGRFKLFLSRPIEGSIKTVTVRRSSADRWFVAFSCDNVPENSLAHTGKTIGIDVGIRNYIATSEGEVIDNPRYFHKGEKLLAYRQRRLSRRKKSSNRRKKARLLVAKAHEKAVNQRTDFCFKTALDIVRRYDTIFVESLDIQNMTENQFVSKKIMDASWGRFLQILSFKAEEAGKRVMKVDPTGTSLVCSKCGSLKKKDTFFRIYHCHCGLRLDRDHNAAINILRLGQSLQGGETLVSPVN